MTRTFTDQLGRPVIVSPDPKRIISLVPSQTELLHDLGLGDRVVGITKFCVHPEEWFHHKTRVGGTKALHLDRIAALEPDLIIANKEENERLQIEALARDFPVWVSDITTLDEARQMIGQVADMTNTDANELLDEIDREFAGLKPLRDPARTTYLIWNEPIMLAGKDTFIDHLMERCGLINIAPTGRYPEIDDQWLKNEAPEHVLLSSEPFPFNETHRTRLQELLPNATVTLVDGEMFSWYGSRLRYAPSYLQNLLEGL